MYAIQDKQNNRSTSLAAASPPARLSPSNETELHGSGARVDVDIAIIIVIIIIAIIVAITIAARSHHSRQALIGSSIHPSIHLFIFDR